MDAEALFTECRFVALVQAAVPNFPTGWIEKAESPDFLIRTESHVVGIEVTRLFRTEKEGASSRVQEEAQRRNTLANAAALATARGLPPVAVMAHFGSNPKIRARAEVVEPLVATVASMIPEQIGETTTRWASWDSPIDPPHMRGIHVTRIPPEYGNQWITTSAGFPEAGFEKALRAAINDKAAKLPDYRMRCDECWLIVGGDGRSASSSFEPPEGFDGSQMVSPFDRTFLVEGWSGKVTKLGRRHEG